MYHYIILQVSPISEHTRGCDVSNYPFQVGLTIELKNLIAQNPDRIVAGRVVGVLKRDLRNVVAEVVEEINEHVCLVQPVDSRLSRVIIRVDSGIRKYIGYKIVVSIDDWILGCAFPFGHLVKVTPL